MTVQTGAGTFGAVGIVAADDALFAAVFAVAVEVDAFAVADVGKALGTADDAAAVTADFVILACGRTVAAVFGVRLGADAAAGTPFLSILAGFFVGHAGTTRADLIATSIAAGTAVILVIFDIDADAVAAARGIAASVPTNGESGFAGQNVSRFFGIVAAGGGKPGECQTDGNRKTVF